jgi:hypothetical protein
MSETSEWAQWVKQHKCTYDIQPVVEMEEGGPSQLGYELNLHAELPLAEGKLTTEAGKTLDRIRDRLGEILESLIPKDTKARIERVPFRRSVRFSKGAGQPMVTRSIRVFHPDYSALQPSDREKLRPTEDRLAQIGIPRA